MLINALNYRCQYLINHNSFKPLIKTSIFLYIMFSTLGNILMLFAFESLLHDELSSIKSPTIRLSDGRYMPIIGLGTYQTGDKTYQTIIDAIDVGYRHIDTAFLYGTEKDIGRALKHVFSTTDVVRDDVWITTKVYNNRHSRRGALESIKLSLDNLNLQYLDLVLIHFPFAHKENDDPYDLTPKDSNGNIIFSDIDYLETWKGLEDAHNSNLVKSIGISNFNHKQIQRLLNNSNIKPTVLQIESHAYLTQKPLIEFCHKHNIQVTAYSPLGRGGILNDPILKSIGEKYKKSSAQILLKYQVQRNVIVIPKTTNRTRLIENINVFDFQLTNNDINLIESLNRNKRFVYFANAKEHKYFPFNQPF